MSDNLKLWTALQRTDPAHTKKFQRAGGFKGTSVKPIYCDRKMTEQFGACGIGWGMTKPEFQVVPLGEEIAVYCTVGLWHGAQENLVYGVGGDFVAKKNKNGLFADDEAFKKAYTDALGNAMKHIGMAADIHMGQHDDDKYVTELRREFAEPEETKPEPKYKQDAETIKAAIDKAVTIEAVNEILSVEKETLVEIGKHSKAAADFLTDRAKKKIALLGNAPAAAA